MSGRVWVMVRKCLQLDAVPLLVARKVAYDTRRIFARLGIASFQMHFQVFSPDVAHLLVDIQHTHRLGFKDVVAMPSAPYGPLVQFLAATLPRQLPNLRARWTAARALLTEFSERRDLGNRDMSDEAWNDHYDDSCGHS